MAEMVKCAVCSWEFETIGGVVDPLFRSAGGFWQCPKCKQWTPDDAHEVDLKFSRVADIPRNYAATSVATKELRPSMDAFVHSMDRVLSFGHIPRMMTLHLESTMRGRPPVAPTTGIVSSIMHDIPDVTKAASYRRHDPPFSADVVFKKVPRGVEIAIDSLFSAMLLGTWTAFETLAGDLWEDAVNACPAFAGLAGNPDRIAEACQQTNAQNIDDLSDHSGERRCLATSLYL